MDVCVVLDVWTIAWNIRWHAGQKGLQLYKWIKGENPGIIIKKKSHRGHGCLSLVSVCALLSGRGLCDEPIPRPGESYRLWCLSQCDQKKNSKPRHWNGKSGVGRRGGLRVGSWLKAINFDVRLDWFVLHILHVLLGDSSAWPKLVAGL
jgi:hypothetical protein